MSGVWFDSCCVVFEEMSVVVDLLPPAEVYVVRKRAGRARNEMRMVMDLDDVDSGCLEKPDGCKPF